jgi:coenzyme F420-reducing hydrogenase gamma subunit
MAVRVAEEWFAICAGCEITILENHYWINTERRKQNIS